MTRKKLLTAVSLLCLSLAIGFAQGPNGSKTDYQAADGKSGAALKTALHDIIKISTAGWSYDGLKEAYKTTDTRADGYLRDWYSNATSYTPGSDCAGSYKVEGDGYNREHLVPQSWFGKASPMKSDIWHVVPSDAKINGERGDKPLGEVGSSYTQSTNGYSKWGMARSGLGYTGQVFEPNDEVKGDIARAYFYMVTCYQDKISSWNATNATYVFDGNTYPGLTDWCLTMMMRWSALDPVDDIEIARNNVIAAKQNRNPFIDYPGLEEYIWGEWQDVEFSYDNYVSPYGGETPTTVSTPTFSPAGGTYATAQTVTISCATSGATIYYTTDGTTPSASSTEYNAAITISETTTLMAIAIKDGTSSSVASATYTINTGGGEPVSVEYEATFNFPENNYGMKELSSSSSSSEYNPNPTTITSDGVSLTMAGDNSSRYWMNTNGTYELRVYKACTMTISAPDNGKITKIVFAGSTISGILNNGKSLSNGTWTGKENSVEFTFNANQKINTIKITYEVEATEPEVLLGDVNNDGEVTIADVTALVNILLGKDASGYDLDAANVNEDEDVTIADVVALVKMILSK